MSVGLDLRARTVDVLQRLAQQDQDDALARDASELLTDLRSIWVRERWRNDGQRPVWLVHEAGPVIDCREYRRSWSATYIVDRRQACTRCGAELIRGRWAIFCEPGERVAASPVGHTIAPATGAADEQDCCLTLL